MVANQASLIISSMMAVLLQVIITAYLNTTAPAHGTAIAQVLLLIQAHGVQQIAPAANMVLLILTDRQNMQLHLLSGLARIQLTARQIFLIPLQKQDR